MKHVVYFFALMLMLMAIIFIVYPLNILWEFSFEKANTELFDGIDDIMDWYDDDNF